MNRPSLDGTKCPTCGVGVLEEKRIPQTMSVDGQDVQVTLTRWNCDQCDESVTWGREWQRVRDDIREARKSYSGRFNVRISSELHGWLVDQAQHHKRSLNQELVSILEDFREQLTNKRG